MLSPISYLIFLGKRFLVPCQIKWNDSFLQWDVPANISADFAFSLALPIAHKTKRSAKEIAQEFIKLIDQKYQLIWEITEQGYINFRLTNEHYRNFLFHLVLSQGKNLQPTTKNIWINFEYISANPTGYLHLGNLRTGIIADVLANIYDFAGYQTVREYYINDRGKQIVDLVDSVYYYYQSLQGATDDNLEKIIAYPGIASQETAQKLIAKWKVKYLNKKLTENDFFLWKETILKIIITRIKQDLEKCGIFFANWFSEVSLYQNNKHLQLIDKLKNKDLVYEKEGAFFFRTTLTGDEKDRVIIKQDGNYTYFFSDILYHLNKLGRADYLLEFWGADHHGYVERVKGACQLLGYNREKIQVILTQMVSLLAKDGSTQKFSKRAGNAISINEALEWLKKDQLRFCLLEKEPNIHLTISKENLLQKENTRLYYLQYAHARCHQIFKKAKEKGIKISYQIDLLESESERKIYIFLVRFSHVLEKIIEENKPHYLIHYLDELAQLWQKYYQNNIILNEENKELSQQRLFLTKNVQIILKLGLNLMGIEAPKIM